jgi:ribonuclease J
MGLIDGREPGIYWQSRMGNNEDGIGGNCHRYDVVTGGTDGKMAHASFVVDYGVKFGGKQSGYASEFTSPKGLFAKRGESELEGGGKPPEALILTHAHEDHLGAVRHAIDMGYQVPPVFATAFTAQILQKSLRNAGIPKDQRPPVTVVSADRPITVAGATVEFVPVDHLPGAAALRIDSPDATVLHTGDYKFDQTLTVGRGVDPAKFREIGAKGVDLLVADSTSVVEDAPKVSEEEIQANLTRVLADQKGRAVVAGVLGSQLDRVVSLGRAAAQSGRVMILTGRSLQDNVDSLTFTGADINKLTGTTVLPAHQAETIPADKALVVTTGAFGQPMAGLTRAADRAPGALWIDRETTVIIPQRSISPVRSSHATMVHRLENLGARVVTAENAEKLGYGPIHQSGHAIAADAKLLYSLVKPRHLIAPMHGGPSQLEANAQLARGLGIEAVPYDHNGEILKVSHQGVHPVGREPVDRIAAEATGEHKKVPRAGKGEGRRAGPVELYRYDTLPGQMPPTEGRDVAALARVASVAHGR